MYHAIFVLMLLTPTTSLEIVCGWHHNCVFERGQTEMKCFGRNGDSQLGYGDKYNRGGGAGEMGSNLPFINMGSNFVVEGMSLGSGHTCAVSGGKAMKCFGRNDESQLGFGFGNTTNDVTTTGDALPFVDVGANTNLSKFAAGRYHTCALSTDAELKCFGLNEEGQCGAGTNTSSITGPPSQINAIDLGANFTAAVVSSFSYHVCVLSHQGTLKCFGDNGQGQLGYGDTTDRGQTPASMGDGLPIVNLGTNFVVQTIATGYYHTCALSTAKTVKCWGFNAQGQCGTPDSTETGDNLPVLEFGAGFVPMQLALGFHHTCILSENATMICFGDNQNGQLGIGSKTNVGTPSTLTGIDLGSNFMPRQISAGYWHSCAVSTNDAVKCWGGNAYGQLGLGHMNTMGDGPRDEMGDNLPIVDVAWPVTSTSSPTTSTASPTTAATPTTASPTTASPTTASPTTASPTTVSPTTASPTTATPTASPTTASPTTASPTTATPTTATPTTASPTTATPTTATPTVAPTTEPRNEPSTSRPTTFEPSTRSPTTMNVSNSSTITVTIRTDSLSSTQILIAVAQAFNSSTTPLTLTSHSSSDGDDGFVTVELLVAVASNVELNYDVIEATLREAMVDEYGEDIHVEIAVDGDETQEYPESSWSWIVPPAICIASVCFCFAVVGVVKYVLAKRRQQHDNDDDQRHLQAAQIEIPERQLPVAAAPNAHSLNSESEDEEKKEDINPGACEPGMVAEDSGSHEDEGRRASLAAQPAVTPGLAAGAFEVVDNHETTAGYGANFVHAAGMEEDEFEVVGDDDEATAARTRGE